MNKTQLQDKIVSELSTPSHGILLLAPRVGKSRIAVEVIKKEKPASILWVTPSVKLRDVDIPNEFKTWGAEKLLEKTTIVCYGSLSKIKGNYEKIILDEMQYISVNNSRPLLSGDIKYSSILCLSGTFPTHEEKREIYTALKLNILKEIGIEEAIDKNLIADYNITVYKCSLDSKNRNVRGGSKAKPFMTTEAKQYNYLSSTIASLPNSSRRMALVLKRMHLIYGSMTKENIAKDLQLNLKGRKIIFAGNIEQAERLSDNTYHSKTDSNDLGKFMAEEIDTLACVKSGGVGFTYKNVDHFIIVQPDSDKRGETTQKFARSLLAQENYKAQIHFIVLKDTVDETWLNSALENFNKDKINWI